MRPLDIAGRFLKSHYQSDDLDDAQIRRDIEHWEMVQGDAIRFPNADLDFIDQFCDAAYAHLGGAA